MADSFCRLSTGISFAGRALYTDFDEAAITLCRPVILNGISELASRPDLLDRAIVVRLPSIQPENRKTEKEFWEEFEAARPSILGALCDATSAALANWEAVELTSTPRMADFVRWAAAAAPSFGLSADDILGAYERNRKASVSDILASDILVHVLLTEIERSGDFEGTATKLFITLNERAVDLDVHRSYGFPKAPNKLSGDLRRLAPALRELGIEIDWGREGPSGQRVIRIRRNGPDTPVPSLDPSPS